MAISDLVNAMTTYTNTSSWSAPITTYADPVIGEISLSGLSVITSIPTPITYISPITITPGSISTWTISDPMLGQVEYDLEGKLLKVYNGAEWVEVKMHDYMPLTEKEVVEDIEGKIKKEIYG